MDPISSNPEMRSRRAGHRADERMPRRETPVHDGSLRVVSWNIKAGHGDKPLGTVDPKQRLRNVERIAAEILASDPDVIMLQEVENGYLRNGRAREFDLLKRLLGATDAQMGAGLLGTAIITRNGVRIGDDAKGSQNRVVTEPLGKSSAMAVPLELPSGQKLTAVNIHADPTTLPELAPTYLAPIREGRFGSNSGEAFPTEMIVGGDFNVGGRDSELPGRPHGVKDAFSAVSVPWDDERRFTGYGDGLVPKLVAKITGKPNLLDRDHLQLTPGVGRVTAASTPKLHDEHGRQVSDHQPVVVDIDIDQSRRGRQQRS